MNDEPKKMDAKEKKALGTEVEAAVKKCLSGEYSTKNEAVEALIADLTALKTPEEEGMGGMGTDADEGMPLPEPEEEA